MKRQLFLVLSLLTITTLWAQDYENYFRKGVKWICKESEGWVIYEADYAQYEPEQIEDLGENCFRMVTYNPENPGVKERKGFFKIVDNNKVIWHPGNPEETGWTLLYDFGLEKNEKCYSAGGYANGFGKLRLVECVSVGPNKQVDGFTNISLSMYSVFKNGDPNHKEGPSPGKWIKGIGSENGPLSFASGNSRLAEVWDGENLVYKNPEVPCGIDASSIETQTQILVAGRTIHISGVPASQALIYNEQGLLEETVSLTDGSASVRDLNTGLHILKIGGNAYKFIIK